jgi:adenylosuccinate synthase
MERFHTEQSALQDANNGYLAAMGEQTGRLQEALQTLSVGYTDTMSAQTEKVNSALQSLGKEYIETMNRQILQMQDDLHSAIQDIFARFTDINTTTFENIEQQSTATIEQLATSAKTVMEEMSDQVTDLGYFTREINAE